MKYTFIVNPKARSGKGEMIWRSLEPELKKKRIDYDAYLTSRRRHAEKIAEDITSDGKEHTLVVLGGDGTVNEVINGICSPAKVTLGYIPIGSSNDFARGLGLPKEPQQALERILSGKKVTRLDVGVLERKGGKRRFAVSAGIGFDAAVCHEVCVSKWKAVLNYLKLGKLSYAVVALDRLMKDRTVSMTITTEDGSSQVFERTYLAAFMNLPFEGGGFKFCPEASPSDGKLDIMIISGLPRLKILCLLPTAFLGKHVRFRGVTIMRCQEAKIETSGALPLHTDGEPAFLRKKIRASLMDETLRVITG